MFCTIDETWERSTNVDLYFTWEQIKAEEKRQQEADKAYYNQLLLELSTRYSYIVIECLNRVKSFYRKCNMQLKTYVNLRF